ncbi:alpha-L-fucosidase [Algibacter lectus]|nr:alpha-L-fucosidase [Algibacter lectus]
MEWWQEARFGMFIHWGGIYTVPAGFYNGEAQTNSAEWIMNKGKIPVAEYEKFADEFNPH